MTRASAYRCFTIRRYRVTTREGDTWVWRDVPAHVMCYSVPWVHPRLRRRVHRKGRR